jgi:hypothetical protein
VFGSTAIMEMPDRGSEVGVRDGEIPAENLLRYHPWSGRHRARGIFLAKGPAIRHRYTGAWTIDDAYARIFRYTIGIVRVMERFGPLLRSFHLVDDVLTLDVAPTVLYLSDLAVAEDMDGRVLTEIIDVEFSEGHPVKTTPTYRIGEILDLKRDPAEEAKIKDRLRALGYIQ